MPDRKRSYMLRILLWLGSGLLFVVLALVTYMAVVAIDRPPAVADQSSLELQRMDVGQNTFEYGNSWLRRSESGLWEAYLEGEPFARGVAFGQLSRELLYFQEASFVEQLRELVPSDRYLKVLKYFIAFFNRNLDEHVPEEYKEEIYGTSFGCSPEFDYIGSGYQRQLNYHAAHDIGHALQGLNLVACTSFSVWNSHAADSLLLVGRNFDFYMGEKFAENKIVCFVNPSKGHKFMMVTWPCMIGVVSGMNEKGLTVTINASKSTLPTQAATPVTLLAREILQYASTIQEAWEISGKRKLFVSESIMVGSAIDHQTAIIEKSPDKADLVIPATDRIICSNHFQGQVFADDENNLENIKGSDSYERYRRVEELLDRVESFDVSAVVSVLRDQRALNDQPAGMGNPLVINQLIAHHAVVFKPDSLMVWISTAPWQLGKFVAYDLKKVFNLPPGHIRTHQEIYTGPLTLPADTFLNSSAFEKFRLYQSMTQTLQHYRKNREPLPGNFASTYMQTNPALYLTYVHLGDYYQAVSLFGEAYDCYGLALNHKLPGRDVEQQIRETRATLKKKLDHGHSRN